MTPLYPWDKLENKQSFFVAGMPVEKVKREVLKDAGLVGYNIRARVGVVGGKFGVLFTRRD